MPRLTDHFDFDNDGNVDYDDFRTVVSRTWDSFTDFALRDNVLEVAVGLIFASSFTAVANSLVSDIILPILSLFPFVSRTIEEQFIILRNGPHKTVARYNTVEQATADGAIVWPYGSFIDKLLRFFLIALSLFLIAKAYGWLASDDIIRVQVRCKYCRKYVSQKATRCVNCTSWLDGREEKKSSAQPNPPEDEP